MFKEIPVSQLFSKRGPLRQVDRKREEYIRLLDSIRQRGLIVPLTVRQIAENRWEILSGHHRFDVCKSLGWKTLPCYIHQVGDEEADIDEFVANMVYAPPRGIECVRRLMRILRRRPNLNVAQLSVLLQQNPLWVKEHLKLNNLCVAAKKFLDQGDLKIGSALRLCGLFPKDQEKLLPFALALSVSDFQKMFHERYKERRAKLHGGRANRKPDLQPKLRGIRELKRIHDRAGRLERELKCKWTEHEQQIAQMVMDWVFQVDPLTIRKRQASINKWEQKLKEEKRARKRERANLYATLKERTNVNRTSETERN